MKNWVIYLVHWKHGREEVREVAAVMCSRKVVDRPDDEINHQLGEVFKRGDALWRDEQARGTEETKALRHPFAPYMTPQGIYPRIEVRVDQSTATKTVRYTTVEGGDWLPLEAHSVQMPDGKEWDVLNGWRGSNEP